MAAVAFDTSKMAQRLEAAGLPGKQAQEIASALAQTGGTPRGTLIVHARPCAALCRHPRQLTEAPAGSPWMAGPSPAKTRGWILRWRLSTSALSGTIGGGRP